MLFLQVPLGRLGANDWSAKQTGHLCLPTSNQTRQRRFPTEAPARACPSRITAWRQNLRLTLPTWLHGSHFLKQGE